MPHQWIIDVLTDMQGFARQNDMPALAQQLDLTLALAAQELARVGCGRSGDDAADGPGGPDWRGA